MFAIAADSLYKPNVEEQNTLCADDFPKALVDAVGRRKLLDMPQWSVDQPMPSFLKDRFSFDMIPSSGAIKGRDVYGRVFITFAVTNDNHARITEDRKAKGLLRGTADRTALVTIYPRYTNQPDVMYHTWAPEIPTDDPRFFVSAEDSSPQMTSDKYTMVHEIFHGTHRDLTLGCA